MPAKRNAREQDRLTVSRLCFFRVAPRNRKERYGAKTQKKGTRSARTAMVPGGLSIIKGKCGQPPLCSQISGIGDRPQGWRLRLVASQVDDEEVRELRFPELGVLVVHTQRHHVLLVGADVTLRDPGAAGWRAGAESILEDQCVAIVVGLDFAAPVGVDAVDVHVDLGVADGVLLKWFEIQYLLLVVHRGDRGAVVVHVDRDGGDLVAVPVVGVAVVLEVDTEVLGAGALVADLGLVAGPADAAAAVVTARHVGAVRFAAEGDAEAILARASGEAVATDAAAAVGAAVLAVTVRDADVHALAGVGAGLGLVAGPTGATAAVGATVLASAGGDAVVRNAGEALASVAGVAVSAGAVAAIGTALLAVAVGNADIDGEREALVGVVAEFSGVADAAEVAAGVVAALLAHTFGLAGDVLADALVAGFAPVADAAEATAAVGATLRAVAAGGAAGVHDEALTRVVAERASGAGAAEVAAGVIAALLHVALGLAELLDAEAVVAALAVVADAAEATAAVGSALHAVAVGLAGLLWEIALASPVAP